MSIVEVMYQKLADANPESYYSYTRRLDAVTAQVERNRLAQGAWSDFESFINNSSVDELEEMRAEMIAKREKFKSFGADFAPANKVLPLIDAAVMR